jgi:uncharacterized phiE125 gp8 family phage protein
MRAKIVVQPTEADEPVTVTEARAHCEAPLYGDSAIDDADDAKFLGWIQAARQHAEVFTGLSLARKTYMVALDEFDEDIVLPWAPVLSVTALTYATPASSGVSSGEYELVQGVDFVLDDFSQPARLVPVSTWPSVLAATNRIQITYEAGYGGDEDQEAVPPAVKQAILLTIGHLYANRESTTAKAMAELPLGIDDLLRPFRISLGYA